MIASHDAAASRNIVVTAASSSRPIPRSIASAPASATNPNNIGRLESRICPGANSPAPSRNSSPVEITPTRIRGYAGTSTKPSEASTPRCAGVEDLVTRAHVPARGAHVIAHVRSDRDDHAVGTVAFGALHHHDRIGAI